MQSVNEPTEPVRVSGRSRDHELRPEYFWLYATIAISAVEVAAYASRSFGASAPVLRSIAGMSPWIVLSVIFVTLYQGTAQRLVARVEPKINPWVSHVVIVGVLSFVVGMLLHSAHRAMGFALTTRVYFVTECVAMSWIVTLPAVAIDRARQRERAIAARLERAERAAVDAQLRALQAQTNPHFLFNSLNVVAGLIHEDPALAERTLERFAGLFRYAIEGSRSERVTLDRELAFVEDYLEVQRLRFGERLETEIDAGARALGVEVPPLLLQPLVENAVLHGMSDGRALRVTISAKFEGDGVRVRVSDDGPGLGHSQHKGTQSSIDTLRARVRAIEGASIWIRDRAPNGVDAEVFLPARREKESLELMELMEKPDETDKP